MYAVHDDTKTDFVLVVALDGSGCGYGAPVVATPDVVDIVDDGGDVAALGGEEVVGGDANVAKSTCCA